MERRRPLRRAGSRRTAGRLSALPSPLRRHATFGRGAAALALLALLLPAERLSAQGPDRPERVLHVYAMRHQAARDALTLVLPLLSPRGTFEVRNSDNTLVLHDSAEAISRILPVLVAFDHPTQPVDVELWLLRASGSKVSPPLPLQAKGIPPDLLRSLVEHLPYQHYGVIGSSKVRGEEGEKMTFQVGGDYAVRFRLGTVLGEQRLRLNDFEVVLMPDNGEAVPLMKSHLNLWLDRPMVLALSSREASNTALMVVVRCRTTPVAGKRAVTRPGSTPRRLGGGHF